MRLSPKRLRRWTAITLVLWVLALGTSVANACVFSVKPAAIGSAATEHVMAVGEHALPCHSEDDTTAAAPGSDVADLDHAPCVQACYQEAAQGQVLKSATNVWPDFQIGPPPAPALAPLGIEQPPVQPRVAIPPVQGGGTSVPIAFLRLTL